MDNRCTCDPLPEPPGDDCPIHGDHAQGEPAPYAVEYRLERDGGLYSYMHAGSAPEGAQDVRLLYLAPTRHSGQNTADIDAAGRVLTAWFGYSWDGITEQRVADKGYKPWCFDGLGHKQYQGGKEDVREIIREIIRIASPAPSPGGSDSKQG